MCGHLTNDGKKVEFGKIVSSPEELRKQVLIRLQADLKLVFILERKPITEKGAERIRKRMIVAKAKGLSQLDPTLYQQLERNRIVYDGSGKVLIDELDILSCRPNYPVYSRDKEPIEYCCFCQGMNSDAELELNCGPMYGPVKVKKERVYFHEMCALWTPELYLEDSTNKVKGLKEALSRCGKIKCTYCGEPGGGLGCMIESCDRSFHYLCSDKVRSPEGKRTLFVPT